MEESKKEERLKEEIQKVKIPIVEAKISKNGRLTIPKYIREKYNIKKGDISEWQEVDNHSVKVKFYSMVKRLK